MNVENTNPPNDEFKARLKKMEAEYDFQRVEGDVTLPYMKTLLVRLGKNALFAVMDQSELTEAEQTSRSARGGRGIHLNPNIKTFLTNETYNIHQGRGYKGIRDGESVQLGRLPEQDLPRFDDIYDMTVSRQHALITKSPDGKTITIKDLQSHNGTYVGIPRVNTATAETITEEQTPTSAYEFEPILVNATYKSTVASERHPERNEDRLLVDTTNNMYAVFDGVGGHDDGELASSEAKRSTAKMAQSLEPFSRDEEFSSLKAAETYLRDTLTNANKQILKRSEVAATTAVLAKVHRVNGELYASIAHIGDSRAYLLKDGVLKALTADHSLFRYDGHTEEAMQDQEILADTDSMSVLTDRQIAMFNDRNYVEKVLGHDGDVSADVKHILVKPGDTIILTTDGVHDNLTTKEMQNYLTNKQVQDPALALTDAAAERARQPHLRAKMDDITAVVVNI